MPGQLLAAQLDSSNEAITRAPILDRGNHCCNGLGPHVWLHLGIDSAVGNDLGITLCDGRENQHAGTVLGEMDALGQKLMHRFSMSAPPHPAFWHDAKADHR